VKESISIDNETETALPISLSQQPLPLWRSRDYVLLWSGQAISSIGTGVSQFALPLFIFGGCLLVLAVWTTLSPVFSQARSH